MSEQQIFEPLIVDLVIKYIGFISVVIIPAVLAIIKLFNRQAVMVAKVADMKEDIKEIKMRLNNA